MASKKTKPWTHKQISDLREMYPAGVDIKKICRKVNRPENEVKNKVNKLKLRRMFWNGYPTIFYLASVYGKCGE